VLKYAPNGKQIWAARYDATNYPSATPTGFALDSSNNVMATGNAVTVKYDPGGNELWTAPYNAQAVAADSGGNIYLTGVSSNFTTMKLNSAGSNLWTASYSNPDYSGGANLAQVLAVDSSSNIYVAGWEQNNARYPNNFFNIAVLKYGSDGSGLWSFNTAFVSLGQGNVVGIVLDQLNNVYLEANFTEGAGDGSYQTYKLNDDGSENWDVVGPTENFYSMASALVLDSLSNVIVTGKTPTAYITSGGFPFPCFSYATFKYGVNGSNLWSAYYPSVSNSTNVATAITVDGSDNTYVTGYSTFTTTGSAISTVKYDANGRQLWVGRYGRQGNGNEAGNAIAVDNAGNVYVAGYETETNGFTSMILIKYSPVTLQKQSNGSVILHAYGAPGESFDLQASTNLQTWQDLGDVIADTNGLVQFDDTNAPAFASRFYYTDPQ
jgi:hypothetical protein